MRFSLFTKIILWFFLNLVVLGAVFFFFFNLRFRLTPNSPLSSGVSERLENLARLISYEVSERSEAERIAVLMQYAREYRVEMLLYANSGARVAGTVATFPEALRPHLAAPQGREPQLEGNPLPPDAPPNGAPSRYGRRGPPPGELQGPPPDWRRPEGRPPGPPPGAEPPRAGFGPPPNRPHPEDGPLNGSLIVDPQPDPSGRRRPPPLPTDALQSVAQDGSWIKTANPTRYWAAVRIPVVEKGQFRATPATLFIGSDSITGHGLFFDVTPWLLTFAVVFGVSILLWLPFVRSFTKALKQMTTVTEQIAEEQFDVRVNDARRDEIGRLGKAINHLAGRLSGFVHGQKRFLGDISHELNSPLARMQFALGILEDRVEPAARSYVADVQEEVVVMTKLVSELLAYSKAGIKQTEIKLEAVNVQSLVQQVIAREAAQHPGIRNETASDITVLANPELLARAVGNVIRNAVRYAGPQVPIIVRTQPQGKHVRLCIADGGPGVPEEALSQLFDPFYRLEADRARNTGGSGLGLAIVKTCIEACQGTVSARNRTPNGLEIVMTLQAA
ncbi:MAG: ATP-binding protein [Blastocatellia bacterium]